MSHASGNRTLGPTIVHRVVASVVFIPCLIVLTRRGGLHFLALMGLVIFLGMWEFYRMMDGKGIRPRRWIGIASGLALSWYLFQNQGPYAGLLLTLGLLGVMGLELARRDEGGSSIANVAATVLGVVYVAFLASHIVLLRELPLRVGLPYSEGSSFVFLAFLGAWSCDTGAYFVGSWAGRHALLPRVSEKKTREGMVGGLVLAIGAVVVARYTFADYLLTWHAVVLGAAAAVASVVGDLVESMFKRDAAMKDASGTIPGHGGVLDRFDSLLFTAPLVYYILKFVIFE